jgi:hypothetical protein
LSDSSVFPMSVTRPIFLGIVRGLAGQACRRSVLTLCDMQVVTHATVDCQSRQVPVDELAPDRGAGCL